LSSPSKSVKKYHNYAVKMDIEIVKIKIDVFRTNYYNKIP